jgi:hypothetical protein
MTMDRVTGDGSARWTVLRISQMEPGENGEERAEAVQLAFKAAFSRCAFRVTSQQKALKTAGDR